MKSQKSEGIPLFVFFVEMYLIVELRRFVEEIQLEQCGQSCKFAVSEERHGGGAEEEHGGGE